MNPTLCIITILFSINLYSQEKLSDKQGIKKSIMLNPKNIKYTNYLNSQSALSQETILLQETFGSGANTTTPNIDSAYCWNNQPFPSGQPCGNNNIPGYPNFSCFSSTIEDNQYSVTSVINPNNCAWFDYRDHTSGSADISGRFLAINIGSATGPNDLLYSKQISNITPNQVITVELYVGNLIKIGIPAADPDLSLELVDENGMIISSQSTGLISKTNSWLGKIIYLNPGSNTNLKFNVRSISALYNGNDVVIDDIKLSQSPVLNNDESLLDKIVIYPNPVHEQLHIDNVVLNKVLMYNVLGDLVKSVEFKGNLNNVFDLKNIPKGVYFLNLQTDESVLIKKIIVE